MDMVVTAHRRPLPALLLLLALLGGFVAPLGASARADEGPVPTEAGRKNAIRGLRSTLRKLVRSPWADRKLPEILEALTALGALRGHEAGLAAMEALPSQQPRVRDAVFAIVEREHHKALVGPLGALLEDKEFRRDADLRRRVAHALAVMDEPTAVEPLASLIRFDEDAEVVAEAADALAGYGAVPLEVRRDAVRRLVDLYETTWNLKESVRPEDRLLRQDATARYKVHGKSLRSALQALTGVQLTRPHEWRRWWNTNKKRSRWGRETDPTLDGSGR
jgi:hypothetical protein